MTEHMDDCECFACNPPRPDRLDDPGAREERFDALVQRLLNLVQR